MAERLYQHLLALPNREAEQALLEFRAGAEAWDVCVGIVCGPHGAVPEQLTLFAAQTLHACARRTSPPNSDDGTAIDGTASLAVISRQQTLLTALVHVSGQAVQQKTTLLCAALAALSVRIVPTIRDMISAALQQLPRWLSVQLLLAVAEEAEALQARAGSEVGCCVAAHHVLREEVGPHVLAWLATAAAAAVVGDVGAGAGDVGSGAGLAYPQQPPQPNHPHFPQQQQQLVRLVVRCGGAWCRLGCLYAACCPATAVRELLVIMLRCAHPGGAGGAGGGSAALLRRESCEALNDAVEHGPDSLLRELHGPMGQLAEAAMAAATAPTGVDVDAVYDVVQLVSSYAAARLGELVTAACRGGGNGDGVGEGAGGGSDAAQRPEGDSAATAEATAEAEALVGALCRLAALPTWTTTGAEAGGGGYPVSWPAVQLLADLALGCIAAVPPPSDPAAATAASIAAGMAGGGGGGVAGDAMQQDGAGAGGTGSPEPAPDADTAAVTEAVRGSSLPSSFSTPVEHCVPDITLGPRPGLPPHLLLLYDNVLHAVLSCGVAWSLLDADKGVVAALDVGSGGDRAGGGGRGAEAVGLLRLAPECEEALRICLQACGGVVGQARQLQVAVALLQHTAAEATAAAAAACPARVAERSGAVAATSTAALTMSLAAVSACGILPSPSPAIAPAAATTGAGHVQQGGGPGFDAAFAAAAASRILLAAADHRHERGSGGGGIDRGAAPPAAPGGLAVPLTLHYCEALSTSCGAVLQLQSLQQQQLQPCAMDGGSVDGAPFCGCAGATLLCRLAAPALAGLQLAATAAAAARALAMLVAAAAAARLPLPAQLAAALVDAAHALPFDAGRSCAAAERELLRAAVAAAAAAGGHDTDRHHLFQRLLSPAVAFIAQTAATATTAQPTAAASPSPASAAPAGSAAAGCHPHPFTGSCAVISRRQDAGLARQLRLLEAALNATSAAASAAASDSISGLPSPWMSASVPAAAATESLERAAAAPAAAVAALFTQQAWPPLLLLLQRGSGGLFLLPLCRCLTLVLRLRVRLQLPHDFGARSYWLSSAEHCGGSCVGGDVGSHDAAAMGYELQAGCWPGPSQQQQEQQQPLPCLDPWVVSMLEALANCVGRPGAKHVYEPLVAVLETCAGGPGHGEAGASSDSDGPGGGFPPMAEGPPQQQQYATLVVRTLYGVLHGRIATELAAVWRGGDRDPDTAECLLRLATAAVRYGGTTPCGAAVISGCCWENGIDLAAVGGIAGSDTAAAVVRNGGTTTLDAAVAAAALHLAAANSGCDHRQIAAAALACTCAVLEAMCGPVPPPAPPATTAARGAYGHLDLLAAVVQCGPVVAAGLLDALLSSSPLPRLQRVATALVLLAAAVATCYGLEQQQQHPAGFAAPAAAAAALATSTAGTAAALAAVGGVLRRWLAAAAAYLQLSEQEGSSLAAAWAPLLAEAGLGAAAGAAAARGGGQHPETSLGAFGGIAMVGSGAAPAAATIGLSRKLRRLLREFAESRLRRA